jgi:hypothetical protein
VVAADQGSVWWSTHPTGGPSAWSSTNVDGTYSLGSISCPSTAECVALDQFGRAISTNDPTGGATAWSIHQAFNPPGVPQSISCPNDGMCVAVQPYPFIGTDGVIAVSTDPIGGQWTNELDSSAPRNVDCPSVSICVVSGSQLEVSTDPASGSWTRYRIEGITSPSSISCASAQQCVVGDGASGYVAISDDPADGPRTWTSVLADRINCASTPDACGTEQIIASDRTGVHTLDSSTEFEPETGPQLTGLSFNGSVLSWLDHGSPKSAELTP